MTLVVCYQFCIPCASRMNTYYSLHVLSCPFAELFSACNVSEIHAPAEPDKDPDRRDDGRARMCQNSPLAPPQ